MARSTPADLASLLRMLRTRARTSQRELARASGISYTQVSDLEGGKGGHPSPLTLRAIARGLATDALDANDMDSARADAYYRQLMAAAGYLRPFGASTPEETSEDDVLKFLETRSGDPGVADLLVRP